MSRTGVKTGEALPPRSQRVLRCWVEVREHANGSVRHLPVSGVTKIHIPRTKKEARQKDPNEQILQGGCRRASSNIATSSRLADIFPAAIPVGTEMESGLSPNAMHLRMPPWRLPWRQSLEFAMLFGKDARQDTLTSSKDRKTVATQGGVRGVSVGGRTGGRADTGTNRFTRGSATSSEWRSPDAMTTGRRTITPAEEVALVSQVDSICPQCGNALFHKKKGKAYKSYEIAHIYPLTPTEAELALLDGQERLSSDVNDVDNLIPLCLGCHGKFDKPRTLPEYLDLLQKKKDIIARERQQHLQYAYELQREIERIVDALDESAPLLAEAELVFDAKPVDAKFNETMPTQTRRKIHRNVTDYFVYVRQRFQNLDREKPGTADLISSQVKTFYLAQKQHGFTQQQIFSGVVSWIVSKTTPKTVEAAEVVASFFVQNCEVFE